MNPDDHSEQREPGSGGFRRALATFWLRQFFRLAEHAPKLLENLRGPLCAVVFGVSRSIRAGTRANAARLLGDDATPGDRNRLAREMLSSFYLFCCDVGRSRNASREEIVRRIESIQGHESYLRARSAQRGVIILTAHMGSFEVGLAALREIEPRIHVLFRRDLIDEFERSRRELRRRLDVMEAPLDEGWTAWIRVRDALMNNEAVVIQGDRVVAGQKGELVPFLGGHLELPVGPVKLARVTGSPIVPVFSIRQANGKIRLLVEEAIHADEPGSAPLKKIGAILEKYVREYPNQWLILEPALREDQ